LLRRVARYGREARDGPAQVQPEPESYEAAAPGVASLLDGIGEDGSRCVLDLGAAAAASLDVYARFARHIRFADLPAQLRTPQGWRPVEELPHALPAHPSQPYDLVFAWDVFDRLLPEYHAPLVARLADITTPTARLHVMAHSGEGPTTRPLRFALLGRDRMRYEPLGAAVPAGPRLMPARVAQLLLPFRVVHGFTLKGELREYVALRQS
jgi:hypothetical protein